MDGAAARARVLERKAEALNAPTVALSAVLLPNPMATRLCFQWLLLLLG